MIRKPQGRALRWASGVLVVASSALTLGVPLASSANAAATTITASPAAQNARTGGTATVNVTTTGTPANIEYTIVTGPDANFPHGIACTGAAPTYTCTVSNTSGNDGTDTIRVYDAPTAGADYSAADPHATDVTVNFSGNVNAVTLAPDSQTTPAGQCATYTITATDTSGNPSRNSTVNVTVAPSGSTTTTAAQFCTPSSTPTGSSFAAGAPSGTTINGTATTGDNGTATFGVTSTNASTTGTYTVTASKGAASDTSTQTFTSGGANAVTTLTVTPTSASGYTGTQANGGGVTYTVKAADAQGNGISGVQVLYEVTSGPDASTTTFNNFDGTTGSDGTSTGTITSTNTGTDTFEFFVNQTGGTGTHTGGPDTGEPTATATGTFQAPPTVSAVTITSPTGSTIPTDQKSTTFTAHVVNGTTAVQGAIVSFSTTGSTATVTPTTGQATTNASGDATFTVTDSSPTAGQAITVTATVGTHSASKTVTYQARSAAAGTLTLTPTVQTVTEGGTVTVKANVSDQFGTGVQGQSINFAVSGRNEGKTSTVVTDASGNATYTYTDTAVTGGTTDSITASDTTTPSLATANATVQYITGSTAPATVTLGGVNTTASPNTIASQSVSATATHTVTATVKNATGQLLAGTSVTFTVSQGFVGAAGVNSTTGTTSYTTTTNAGGVATADVGSTKTGTQTVTATAGTASASGTITYNNSAEAPVLLTLTPPTANIEPGGSQHFTATVTDQFGNGVVNQPVTFTQSGPGSIGGSSSSFGATDANGQASVTVSTLTSDTGTGSVTATDLNIVDTSKQTDTSTYTLASPPTSLTLSAASGTKAGGMETVTGTLTRQDGTAAPNVAVRFTVTGANSASGSATTDSSGVATFSYKAAKAGTDNISAFADTNNDGAAQPTEPTASATATIGGNTCPANPTRENPTITAIHSGTRGHVTIHVTSHPKVAHASVHYYKVSKTGHRHLLGTSHTNRQGKDSHQFKLTPGKTYKFQVRVYAAGRCDLTPGLSGRQSQKVHK